MLPGFGKRGSSGEIFKIGEIKQLSSSNLLKSVPKMPDIKEDKQESLGDKTPPKKLPSNKSSILWKLAAK